MEKAAALNRREFTKIAGLALTSASFESEKRHTRGGVKLVLASSNLGLRPTEDNGQQGTWRAPQALLDAGLARAVYATDVVVLERPVYEYDRQFGTTIRNGLSIRGYSLALSDQVRNVIDSGAFPLVIGGDCSILLGCLYGARLAGGRGLIHIDGHCDFFHPGNYDTTSRLGSVAGMDLALASGRGELLLTHWPGISGPLADDEDIIQLGEREADDPGFKKLREDFVRTGITQLTIQRVLSIGIARASEQIVARLQSRNLDRVWLHVDFDVLDQAVMPAVDSPGSPGLDYDQLTALIAALCGSGRVIGADFTIYDPNRDPHANYAEPLAECIARGIQNAELEE